MMEAALVAIAVLNLVTFAAFGIDKRQSKRRGGRRIPERWLLALALLGGTAGAYAARSAFQHKTRKQPFAALLHAIAAIQIAALLAFAALA